MPITRTVSIRNFRENMTKFLKEGQEKNVHFVVMRHSEPIAHVVPVKKQKGKKKDRDLDDLIAQVARAREQARQGNTYSTDEVRHILGL